MSVNAFTEEYEYIELFGKPGLFTNARIDRDTVPEGWYAYDLRGSDYDPGEPVTVEPSVVSKVMKIAPVSCPPHCQSMFLVAWFGSGLMRTQFCWVYHL